jgi:DNA-binding transcriptional LysR family regulator
MECMAGSVAQPVSFFQSMDCIFYIRCMNLAALDLNLLVALDALLAEAHVGRAAQRIGLSQPAASHALARLRALLNDPLLVRVGARMEPTPRAEALREPLAEALDRVRGLLVADRFDPAASQRRFLLMMPDLVVDVLMPDLVERVAAAAPGVRLDVTPWRGPELTSDAFLRSIDLAICCTGDALPGFHRQRLYSDRDRIAVRRGHPDARRLSGQDGFLAARHVAVVGPGQPGDMIDDWLREQGVVRTIALAVPSYLQALRMAARTDLVAFVPSRLIAALAEPMGLEAVEPPLDPGIDEQYLFHPVRAQVDSASIWLRTLVLEIGRGLDRPARQAA